MANRIVFMGSPDFALPTLQTLADHYAVAGVVTQPDRPAGRGRNLTPPPVKVLAGELGFPVIQPKSLRDLQAITQLRTWEPDLVVVAAFGQILRPEVLDLPPLGCINVHASLLPRWRGAAPIQAALLQGDQQTGVTIMKMDPGIDTGPILSQRAIAIHSEETGGSLAPKLAQLGAELLIDTLPSYLSGELKPQAQQGETSYAPMLKKSDGQLDFTQTAKELECKVRAFNPWPGAFLDWQGGRLKIHRARVVDNIKRDAMVSSGPGRQIVYEDYPAVITVKGSLVLVEVQPAGKKPMSGEVFLRGAREWVT
jgi:methionyl-tRNA formyltransferase